MRGRKKRKRRKNKTCSFLICKLKSYKLTQCATRGFFYFKCLLKAVLLRALCPGSLLPLRGREWTEGLSSHLNRSLGCCGGDTRAQASSHVREVKRGKQNIIGTLHSYL